MMDSSFSSQFAFCLSSRRRHTRYIGDWSSDVCSSDLDRPLFQAMFGEAPTRRDPDSPGGSPRLEPATQPKSRHDQLDIRSQESQNEVQIQVQHQAARDLAVLWICCAWRRRSLHVHSPTLGAMTRVRAAAGASTRSVTPPPLHDGPVERNP